MVICKVSCPIYNTCKEREPHQRCIYDLGMFNGEEDKDDDDFVDKITYQENNSFKIMTLMDKDTQKFFNQKMRICLLGETSAIPQNKVIEMCRKFFELGIAYNKKE